MYEEYEIFREPSEADRIINEAKAALADLLTDEVSHTIEDAAGAKERLENIQREIRSAEYKLRIVQEQLQEAQKKAESAEMRDIPKKYIDRFVRNATGNFAPGDTVWIIKEKGCREQCQTCGGKKKVLALIGGEEKEIKCPDCNGIGEFFRSKKEVEKTKVSDVYLKLCFSEDRVNYWNTECVFVGRHEYSLNPEKIYTTEEAAQLALEQNNICNPVPKEA